MSFWQRLMRIVGYRKPSRLSFTVEEELLESLQTLSEKRHQTPEEAASGLFQKELATLGRAETNLQIWKGLTPREQEIAALICLDYTNRQIAAQLSISIETVKSHTTSLLRKFNLTRKAQLRMLLADWDFTQWNRKGKKL